MSRAEDIPRAQNRSVHSALSNDGFAGGSNLDVGLHDRSRVSHAEVDKMPDASLLRGVDGAAGGGQVDAAKLCCLCGAGMRDTHQLHKNVGWKDVISVGGGVESVANDRAATRWKFAFRAGADQRPHLVTAL